MNSRLYFIMQYLCGKLCCDGFLVDGWNSGDHYLGPLRLLPAVAAGGGEQVFQRASQVCLYSKSHSRHSHSAQPSRPAAQQPNNQPAHQVNTESIHESKQASKQFSNRKVHARLPQRMQVLQACQRRETVGCDVISDPITFNIQTHRDWSSERGF